MLHTLAFAGLAVVAAVLATGRSPIRDRRCGVVALGAAVALGVAVGWAATLAIKRSSVGDLAGLPASALAAAAVARLMVPPGLAAPRGPVATLAPEALTVLPALALLVVAWSTRYPALPFYRDSGLFSFEGERILAGSVPIRDVWGNPTLVSYVDAVALALGGPVRPTLFWLDLAWSVLLLIAAAWVTRRLAGRLATMGALVWLVLFYRLPEVLQEGNLTEQYAIVPLLLAIGQAIRAQTVPRSPWRLLAAAGVLSGVAMLFRPNAFAVPAAILLTLLTAWAVRRDRSWPAAAGAYLASAAAVGIAAAVYLLASKASLTALLDQVITYPSLYSRPLSTGLLLDAQASLATQTRLVIPAVLGVIGLFGMPWRRHALPTAVLLASLPLLELAVLVRSGYFYGHYYLMLIPATTLLVAFGLEQSAARVAALMSRADRTGPALAAATLLYFALAASFPLASLLSTGGLRSLESRASVSPYEPDVLAFIRSNCTPHQVIYVWGYQPQVYALTDRPAASTYSYLVPLQTLGYGSPERTEELASDLTRARPCVIVDVSTVIGDYPPLDPTRRATWAPPPGDPRLAYDDFAPVMAVVDSRYRSAGIVDDFQLYVPVA